MSEPRVVWATEKDVEKGTGLFTPRRTMAEDRPHLLVGPVGDDGSVPIGRWTVKRHPHLDTVMVEGPGSEATGVWGVIRTILDAAQEESHE